MDKGLVVIGSFMMDLVVRTPRAPQNGETIIGNSFARFPGGKGANQACAAAKLGATVAMAGKVGADPFGEELTSAVEKCGVDSSLIVADPNHPSGVGSITLEADGSNRIIVVPGANLHFDLGDLENIRQTVESARMLLMQLEMDISMTEAAIAMAEKAGVPVMLNPAPACPLSDSLLARITYLTPNETEATLLTGVEVTDLESARQAGEVLLAKGVQNACITLGKQGACVINAEGIMHVPGYKVKVVDTVAAGDTFNGALACALLEGKGLQDALQFANAAGALAVTREGAIPSIPTRQEVEELIKLN